MSAEARRSYGWSFILVMLGLIPLYGGTSWLLVVLPAAGLIWFSYRNRFGSARNGCTLEDDRQFGGMENARVESTNKRNGGGAIVG